jgi:two-component sensor histidine kinase/ligand-binding sensor domain-containing protein
MLSFKAILSIVLLSLLTSLVIAQTWLPLPKGNFIPSTKTTQKAIWTEDTPPQYYKKVTETFINKKPIFQGIVKPINSASFVFKKYPLSVAEEIPIGSSFPFKDVSKLNIKYLDKAHGLFTDEITDITEDKEGLIYLSSRTALAIYNGNTFKLLKSNSEFELIDIENLYTDSKGLIWIATYHGIAYIKDDYLYVPENQIEDHVWRIREDKNSNIWISTQSKGVYKIDNKSVHHYFDKKYVLESFDTHLDDKNKLWIALPDGIAFLKQDSLFQYKLPTNTSSPRCYYEKDNEIWIGTFFGGLQKIRNDSLFYVEAETASRSVYEIMSDKRGIWFSSYGYGMRLITKENMVVTINKSEGLTNNGAIYFYIDRFSNVWVSDAQQGLSRIDDNILFYSRENLEGGPIGDIEKYEEDVWFFYNGDYLRRIINGKRYKYTNEGSIQIPQNRYHMCGSVVGKNEAWLANYNSGVVHLKDEHVTYYRTNESDYENSALQVEFDDSKRLWYYTRLNKLRYFKNDSIYSFDATSFEEYTFQDIVYGKQTGYIYAVSSNYIIVIDENQYKKIESQKKILAVFENTKGELWVFMEDGIKIYQNLKEVQSISSKIFENTSIKAIECIDENKFLIATSNVLIELLILKDKIEHKEYNQTKGLHLPNINFIKLIDSTVFVISDANLYYYNSILTAKNTTSPSLKIEKVLINSEEVSSKNIVLQQNQSIDFLFALINWGQESILEIRIDKNGKLGKWEKMSKDYLSLKELSYGNYRLNVKVSNSSASSVIHSIDFTVQPYFYQSFWFILMLLLIAFIIIFGYFRYRIKKAQKIRIELEKTIDEKTKEITIEKNEVTKQLHENKLLLKEVNHRVKNNFQMVSSLLELQSSHTKNKEAQELLNIGISRIKSIGLAHHKLYSGDNYSTIDLKEYIESITNDLTFGTDKNVELYLDKHYDVNIEKAQALGFIVNELITNSIKYAWEKNDSPKKININFVKEGSVITFKYSDNGRGFQKNIKNHSLGSILISSFVSRQLMGELKTYNESGAVTLITFNEEVLK